VTLKQARFALGCAILMAGVSLAIAQEDFVPQQPEKAPAQYSGCFMMPKFLLPSFYIPDFQKRLKDLPDFVPSEQQKSDFVRSVFLKPEIVRPVILRPEFERCVTRRYQLDTEGGYKLVPVISPIEGAKKTEANSTNEVASAQPASSKPEANPNEAFFYKPPPPPAPQVADCCGGQNQKAPEVRTLPEAPKVKIQ